VAESLIKDRPPIPDGVLTSGSIPFLDYLAEVAGYEHWTDVPVMTWEETVADCEGCVDCYD
jgi:hypothetical protein